MVTNSCTKSAMVMVDVEHLCPAVPNLYRYKVKE
jgi:hypothetical protein